MIRQPQRHPVIPSPFLCLETQKWVVSPSTPCRDSRINRFLAAIPCYKSCKFKRHFLCPLKGDPLGIFGLWSLCPEFRQKNKQQHLELLLRSQSRIMNSLFVQPKTKSFDKCVLIFKVSHRQKCRHSGEPFVFRTFWVSNVYSPLYGRHSRHAEKGDSSSCLGSQLDTVKLSVDVTPSHCKSFRYWFFMVPGC